MKWSWIKQPIPVKVEFEKSDVFSSFDLIGARFAGLEVRPTEDELRTFFNSRVWLSFLQRFTDTYNRHIGVAFDPRQSDRVTHMSLGAADTIKAVFFDFPRQLVSVAGKETSEKRLASEERVREQMRRIIDGYFNARPGETDGNSSG